MLGAFLLMDFAGQLCARLTPLPAHKPRARPVGDTAGTLSPPHTPLAAFDPCFISFQLSPKASWGVGSRLWSFVQPKSC